MLCAGRSLRQLRVPILAGRGHYVARGAQAVSLRCPTTDFRPPHRHVEGRRGKRAMATSSAPPPPPPLRFHTFDVGSQVFVERPHTLALVNLKPIVPLHTLVIPRTPYKRLTDIPRGGPALHELFDTVQDIVQMCQSLTGAPACTVAIQDGAEAVSSRGGGRVWLARLATSPAIKYTRKSEQWSLSDALRGRSSFQPSPPHSPLFRASPFLICTSMSCHAKQVILSPTTPSTPTSRRSDSACTK